MRGLQPHIWRSGPFLERLCALWPINTSIYWSILRELAGNIQYQYLESAKTIFWYLLIQHRSWLVAAKAFQHRSWLAACCVPVAPDPFIGRGVPEFSCFPRFSHVLNRILTECSNELGCILLFLDTSCRGPLSLCVFAC